VDQKLGQLLLGYMTIEFLIELQRLNFLESDYYKNLKFSDKYVHEHLPAYRLDNQGSLLITLYALLVIPKHHLENKYPAEFSEVNKYIDSIKTKATSNYKSDKNGINYLRHIRNAVSHPNVDFVSRETITFTDKNDQKGEVCVIVLPAIRMGNVLTALQQKIFGKLIDDLKREQQSHS
jgi:hypothetical protein